MMRNIRIAAFAAAVLLLALCGCAAPGTAEISIESCEYETDNSKVYAEGIELSGIEDTQFAEEINSNVASDIDSAMISFDSAASQSPDNVRMGNRCILQITQKIMNNSSDLISIVEEHYVYTGGAHGSTRWYPRNIDTSLSKTIVLSDLFSEDGYADTLNRIIDEMLAKDPETYSELWEHPRIKAEHEKDFYIKDGNLVIFYQPYDLSYYAKGFVEFPIKLSELSGYLKEEYRRLIPE